MFLKPSNKGCMGDKSPSTIIRNGQIVFEILTALQAGLC